MSNGTTRTLPVGAWVSLEKPRLQELIDLLKQAGYRTVGPRVADAAIVYDELDSVSRLPLGILDEQDGGRCITWCPVGIDLTEEVAAIRGDAAC